MPAYNEENRIGGTLQKYSDYYGRLRASNVLDYEILVVINNTKDRTEEIVRGYMHKNPNIRYLNFKQGGKGFAVIEGFKDSLKRDSELIGFVDADGATPPEAFYLLVRGIGDNDGIIASRYLKGSIVQPKPSFQRIISSRIFNILIRATLMLPYRDTQCGAKLFKREALIKTISSLSMSQWAFDVELIYQLRKKGFVVREAPTKWADKEYSKINFSKAAPFMALSIIRLRILNSPLKKAVYVYNKIINWYRKAYK